MVNPKYQYKGIAIFGLPASGKTTIAREIARVFSGSHLVEAADLTIRPIAALPSLPTDFNYLAASVIKNTRSVIKISRENARKLFSTLQKKYSPVCIAQLLARLHEQKYPKKFLIIAGARGLDNALFLKRAGYFIVYIKTSKKLSANRLMKRDGISRFDALKEIDGEANLFKTPEIANVSHVAVRSNSAFRKAIKDMARLVYARECKRCVNTTQNPSIRFNKQGICAICVAYQNKFDSKKLKQELSFFRSFISRGKKYDCMVGISGGKDSTATLYTVKEMGFRPLAFTFDLGYYPSHIFQRAENVAKELRVDYQRIDIRKYIRPIDRAAYKLMAELYDQQESPKLQESFLKLYEEGREHYSVKCKHALAFVRTCQLCRRIVIRAYWQEAVKRGIKLVVLGMNEWAGLAKNQFSAIRKLKPFKNKPAVYIVHLPFLLGRKVGDTRRILSKLGWQVPRGEILVESNANSCLLARAAESKARRMLGFHPDSTRLAREVTVGFISKKQAKRALEKIHHSKYSVRQVLQNSKIL